MKPPPQPLRAASYNIRVDHTDDRGTVHDWPYRRALVTSSIVALRADVIGLQEPSPTQAAHLQVDLGPAWGVAVAACDPEAWRAAGPTGPAEGQKRDGNGVAWRRDRLRLLSMDDFALPSDSPFKRSCVVARLRDRASGCELSLLSAHFDHEGDDELGRGSAARRASAALVMARARAELERGGGGARAVLVTGDCTPPPSSNPRLATTRSLHQHPHCNRPRLPLLTRVRSCTVNTFLDRRGDCYRALVEAAGGMLLDVRDADGAVEVDAGRGASSWEGWLTNAWARAHRGDQRYDQVFVSRAVRVLRSSVPEERYPSEERSRRGEGGSGYEYASDHLPIVVDLLLPVAPPPTARRWGAALARGRLPVGWRAQAAPAVTMAAATAAAAACLLLARMLLRSCGRTLR